MFTRISAKSHDEWLKNRTVGIGGSDSSAILGISPFKSNIDLWLEKTGQKEPEDISDDAKVKYGHDAEDSIRNLFMLDHPEYELFHDEYMILRSNKYPFLQASLDGELTEIETGKRGILEIKTTEIMNKQMLDEWKNGIPNHYYTQCLHYLIVTGYEFVWLRAKLKFVWDSNYQEIRDYYFTRAEVIEDMKYLFEKEEKFWNENVMKGVRPGLILPAI
ncbi:MAG: YqaJ viral recombinase family protein [Candidatus Faecenecus gallistercoris]|nr:YqaJ viral recombinase family protein [Bacillota bacterium]MDY4051062.1 YqaJ viral recombinase family protein [Candidatus Faecenecus gallistercoris]